MLLTREFFLECSVYIEHNRPIINLKTMESLNNELHTESN